MTDTLDWLETIGRDAALQGLSPAALGTLLREAHASPALLRAVAEGSGEALRQEFGIQQVPHTVQTDEPGFGDEPDGAEEPAPDEGGNDAPRQPLPRKPPGPAPRPARDC